jgi:hypothetical protein
MRKMGFIADMGQLAQVTSGRGLSACEQFVALATIGSRKKKADALAFFTDRPMW